MTKRWLLQLVPLALLAVGSCGGDGDDSPGALCNTALDNLLAKCGMAAVCETNQTLEACRTELLAECAKELMKTTPGSNGKTATQVTQCYATAASCPAAMACD